MRKINVSKNKTKENAAYRNFDHIMEPTRCFCQACNKPLFQIVDECSTICRTMLSFGGVLQLAILHDFKRE